MIQKSKDEPRVQGSGRVIAKTNRFIVYSKYGYMTHVFNNEYGVTFCCNPLLSEHDDIVPAFEGKELAESHKTDFYTEIAEVQYVAKVQRYFYSV
jgi:hypothetical protein